MLAIYLHWYVLRYKNFNDYKLVLFEHLKNRNENDQFLKSVQGVMSCMPHDGFTNFESGIFKSFWTNENKLFRRKTPNKPARLADWSKNWGKFGIRNWKFVKPNHAVEHSQIRQVVCTLGGVKSAGKDPSFAQSLVIFAN